MCAVFSSVEPAWPEIGLPMWESVRDGWVGFTAGHCEGLRLSLPTLKLAARVRVS